MTLPDNRVRLSATKIDFINDVGVASQDHDNYPPPQGQARFDHMRMFLIGLLAQQSSYDEPTEYRDGTPWFDLNTLTLKIRSGGEWKHIAESINLETDANVVRLSDWYESVNSLVISNTPELFFGGTCTSNGISVINIPVALQDKIYADSRVFLTVNGTAIDPREIDLIGSPNPTQLSLNTVELETNDTFFVSIRRIQAANFISNNVVVP